MLCVYQLFWEPDMWAVGYKVNDSCGVVGCDNM